MEPDTTRAPGLLGGIRIIDFSRVLAGPYCTAMLADLGADVIKVEPPQGDDQRMMGVIRDGESVNFALINRGKKSVCLDLKDPDALDAARKLVATADVLVQNFRPGAMSSRRVWQAGPSPERRRWPRPASWVCCSLTRPKTKSKSSLSSRSWAGIGWSDMGG